MSDHERIALLWRKTYSDSIHKYNPYQVTTQFERIAKLFTPGDSYFYVLNLHNLELDYVSEGVENLIGIKPATATMEKLLKVALPDEIDKIEKKERLIDQFFQFLKPDERLHYKIVYSYKMKDAKGTIRTMLHQANVLSLNDQGVPQHVFSVHSDISHLKVVHTNEVSFIHLAGDQSYYNIDPSDLPFNAEQAKKNNQSIVHELSSRELEIVKLLSQGLNAKQIGEALHISKNTVRTHRTNMLNKAKCTNTAELIAKVILGGLDINR